MSIRVFESDLSRSGAAEPAVSIVLPTFNRQEGLQRVLDALEAQDYDPAQFDVVIADDGSSDGTAAFLEGRCRATPIRLKAILSAQNGGPAKARNVALGHAAGGIVIIIGDDIVVSPDFVSRHVRWHSEHPADGEAVLGFVTWPSELKASAFMNWLEDGGRLFFFRFADFPAGEQISSEYFYTCNVSVKRKLLFSTALFDESFPYASHEDLELGHRLMQQGMTLYYEPSIVGTHWHFLTVQGISRRVYLMGYSADLYWDKVRDSSSWAKKCLRWAIRQVASNPLTRGRLRHLLALQSSEREQASEWKSILTLSYWIGLSDAGRGRAPRVFSEEGDTL